MKKTIMSLSIVAAGLVAAGGAPASASGSPDTLSVGRSVTEVVDRSQSVMIDPTIVHIDSLPADRDCPLTPGPFASKAEYLAAAAAGGGIPPQTDPC